MSSVFTSGNHCHGMLSAACNVGSGTKLELNSATGLIVMNSMAACLTVHSMEFDTWGWIGPHLNPALLPACIPAVLLLISRAGGSIAQPSTIGAYGLKSQKM